MFRFHDSFDDRFSTGGSNPGVVSAKYTAFATDFGGILTTPSGISGFTGQCLLLQANNSFLEWAHSAGMSEVVWGYRWKMAGSTVSAVRLVEFRDGSTVHLYVQRNAEVGGRSTLSVYKGDGTLLGTTVEDIDWNIVSHLAIKALIHDTTGSVELRINGVASITLTNVDTRNGGNATVDRFRIGPGTGTQYSIYAKDIFFFDTTGTYNNTFPGNYRVLNRKVNDDGTTTQWTRTGGTVDGNYTAVDEVNYDDDTSFVSADTVGFKDTYTLPALADTGIDVKVRTLHVRAKKDDVTLRSIAPVVRAGGTDYVGDDIVLTTSYVNNWMLAYETDPDTDLPWDGADLSTSEIGVEVTV